MNDSQRDDLLSRMDERLKAIERTMGFHLKKHEDLANGNRAMRAMVAVAVISAMASLLAALVK